jgi:K+-transporting ATPase ATPase C chain
MTYVPPTGAQPAQPGAALSSPRPPAQPARRVSLLSHLRPAVTLIVLFTFVTGVAFPLAFVGFGTLAFPFQAGGSLVSQGGAVIGSALIGQNFTSDRYFHPRPSALMGTDPKDASKQVPTPYDASESGASNLAATSRALSDRVAGAVAGLGHAPVPGDAVTSSGSGLDPDISPENAALQTGRVAAARHMAPEAVSRLVSANTSWPLLGFIGRARVNVLALNRALDSAAP